MPLITYCNEAPDISLDSLVDHHPSLDLKRNPLERVVHEGRGCDVGEIGCEQGLERAVRVASHENDVLGVRAGWKPGRGAAADVPEDEEWERVQRPVFTTRETSWGEGACVNILGSAGGNFLGGGLGGGWGGGSSLCVGGGYPCCCWCD